MNDDSSPTVGIVTPATDIVTDYRYLFRARVLGNFEWICPCCGRLIVSTLRPSQYVVKCTHEACRRTWLVGHVLHENPYGRKQRPDDTIVPRHLAEAFPEGDVGRWWRNGSLLHCVHTATGSLAIPDIDGSGVDGGR